MGVWGKAISGAEDLVAAGLAAPGDLAALAPVLASYKMRITPEMVQASASAGVARQFVPRPEELERRPEELTDPIGDGAHSPAPGLTHRYPDRVILAVTHACEVYCRFCFRREVVGQSAALPEAELAAALDYIARTPAVTEVILTGGDPLSLSARRLGEVMRRLAAIPHVGVLRLHSRVPVVAPERMTQEMIAALQVGRPVYLVVHTNHAEEIGAAAEAALGRLADAGVALLSQSVLLRGVNDDPATLAALFRRLVALRVKPYYLHHCDLAPGTSHFRTTIGEGQALMQALRGRISGLCLPSYVLDIPGGFGKVPVAPPHVVEAGPGLYEVTDWQGGRHLYRDPERDQAAALAPARNSMP
ncbi:lysine-2,3-aminomutase-like protein [Solirhodobacter olei]|uniref:lysine-2,3-aminomutase-like protein n=1 Tax=Solirhodobacter olei TaxID=2493082 RepID=UPI000FD8AF94|nr:lysine-2,3-aminomutase-like protein [Solirhodobacter olei]